MIPVRPRQLGLLLVVVVPLSLLAFRPQDPGQAGPVFRGEPLAAWLPRLDDLDPDVQNTAAFAMGRFGPPARPAIPALVRILRAEETTRELQPLRSNAEAAADALGRIGVANPDVLDALAQQARRDHTLSQVGHAATRAAIRALGELGAAAGDAVPALIEVVERPLPAFPTPLQNLTPVQREAARALGAIGAPAAPALDALTLVARSSSDVMTSLAARKAIEEIHQARSAADRAARQKQADKDR